MLSTKELENLCVSLSNSGKKLEILIRQMKTFERVETENQSSFDMGLLSEKDYNKNMKRIGKEKAQVSKKIKKLLENVIKDILKST